MLWVFMENMKGGPSLHWPFWDKYLDLCLHMPLRLVSLKQEDPAPTLPGEGCMMGLGSGLCEAFEAYKHGAEPLPGTYPKSLIPKP